MSNQQCKVTSGEVVLVANTAKTLLQIKAAANQRVKLLGFILSGKQAAGGTDPVTKFRFTQSTANYGTGTAATPIKRNTSNSETVQTTAAFAFTVEPTSPTDIQYWIEQSPEISQTYMLPYGQELDIPGGQSLQLEATSSGTPTWVATFIFEE